MKQIQSPDAGPDSLTSRLRRVEWRVTKLHGEVLRPFGVNMYQAMSLIYIARRGGEDAVNQRTIEKYLYLSNPGVSKIVSFLEREGYVERDTDPRDARSHLLRATERGAEFARQLDMAIAEADRALLSPLTPAEQRRFLALMEKMGGKEEAHA